MRLVDALDELDGLESGAYKVEVEWDGGYHLLGEEGYSLIHDLAAQVVSLWSYVDKDVDDYALYAVLEGTTSTEDIEYAVARYANNDKPWRGILKYEEREEGSIPYLAIVVR